MSPCALSVLLIVATFLGGSQGFQCGHQAGGAVCSQGACCSQWGYCGFTQEHCGSGCQSQCSGGATPSPPPPPPSPPSPPGGGGRNCSGGGVAEVVTEYLFNEMLLHRNDPRCPGRGFYTYEAFLCAAETFPEFGNKGDMDTRRREVAAFFGQTSHETTGGWPTAEDGPYAWGYCHVVEVGQTNAYCVPSTQWPCVPGKTYFGRGPIQLSYNYNYGPAGQYLGLDLLGDPDMVGTEAIVSFETALWFWMTAQPPKPSSHDVIIGAWTPSAADIAAGRFPGYGVITNIINGGLECGIGQDARVQSRIGFYKRYCDILGLSYGDNLDCSNQMPFG